MTTFSPKGNIAGPIMPEYILNKKITAGAKLVYALLCNYANTKDHCWPSHATLAKRIACSVSSIKNYLRELVDEGLIAIRAERYRSSVYYMVKQSQILSSKRSDFDQSEAKIGYLNNSKKLKKEGHD